MYASIRRYKTSSAAEVTRRVNEGFVPRISNVAGLFGLLRHRYGERRVSVFETEEGEEESNRVAADWVKEAPSGLLGPVEITAGEVVVHKAK